MSKYSFGAVADEWQVHWRTGFATVVGIGLCASVATNIFSQFIQPLEMEFGWTRGQISAAQSASLLSALLAPLVGRLLDRQGVRRWLLGGMVLMALCYVGLATMQAQLWQFYLLTAATVVVGVPTSGLSFARVLSAAFVRSRGFSLAVGRSGVAIGGMLLPPFLYVVISQFGWRIGYLTMAGLILLLAFPICWAWIEREPAPQNHTTSATGGPVRGFVFNWRIPVLALCAALAYMPILAITSQLQALLTESGILPTTAAALSGVLGISTFVGAIATGLLIDRFWAPAVAFAMLTLASLGALLLLFSEGRPQLTLVALLLLGLAQGAETDIVAYLVARYFGTANFSSIYGLMIFAISLSASIGFTTIGWSHDLTGSYDLALGICSGLLLLSAITYLTLGRYPH